ncbi:hypothetical protein [Paenibacillus sp. 2KB_22]|uniref:hypothetical protein n=1 Tax=Paenibacillus sp. 2KB_22 TaxID=3232978 RepID=UPI003F9C23DA
MPIFRSKPGSFTQACRGTSRESDAAGGEKAVKDALQSFETRPNKADADKIGIPIESFMAGG